MSGRSCIPSWHIAGGDLEGDLAANYAHDVLLLSAEGLDRGHDGVRKLASILSTYVPESGYRFHQILVEDDAGLLVWTADGERCDVGDGADTFPIHQGSIVVQTIRSTRRTGTPPHSVPRLARAATQGAN